MNNPKVTIITCTLNSANYLKENIKSVQEQTYRNIEHLFIDGGSTDDTIKIIKSSYPEPKLFIGLDESLYDAFNKGLSRAQGDIVGFLNSDDTFYDNNSVNRIAQAFKNEEIDYYCAKIVICDKDLINTFAILGDRPHEQTLRDQLYSSTYFAHPTYYCRKDIIKKVGSFNLKYKIASDIDWLYRLESTTKKFYFDENFLVKFRGEGGTSATKYFLALKEEFIIRKQNEGSSFKLIIVYLYHFLRRTIRFFLEKIKSNKMIHYCRKILMKLRK